MTYAQKLKELRKKMGNISMAELARKTGFNASVISKWENNDYTPTKAKLNKLISILKLPQDYFVGCTLGEKVKKEIPQKVQPKKVVVHHTNNRDELKALHRAYKDKINRLTTEISIYEEVIVDLERMIKHGVHCIL